MMFWYGSHFVLWQAVLASIGMLAFWGLLFWAAYSFFTTGDRRDGARGEMDPRRVLNTRLARGEIDADQYRRSLDLISSERTTLVSSGAGK